MWRATDTVQTMLNRGGFVGGWALQLQRRFSSRTPMNKPFKKVMACNRGEIAIRICRAATELCASQLVSS